MPLYFVYLILSSNCCKVVITRILRPYECTNEVYATNNIAERVVAIMMDEIEVDETHIPSWRIVIVTAVIKILKTLNFVDFLEWLWSRRSSAWLERRPGKPRCPARRRSRVQIPAAAPNNKTYSFIPIKYCVYDVVNMHSFILVTAKS